MMQNFHSTFILCFLGFLFIQARAIPTWKSCTANSDCQATGEFCIDGDSELRCIYNIAPIFAFTLTSSSVLTYVKEAGYENNAALCPSFDTCTKNCRKEYSVEKTLTQVTLTSTFTDTTECVCDKLVFNYELLSGDDSLSLISTSTGFGTPANTLQIQQYTSAALDMWIMEENSSGGATVDCVWEYSISTPSTTPSSSSTSKLKVLVGLFSATFVALMLA